MGRNLRKRTHQVVELALELAETGLYRNVGEVEAAVRARHPELEMTENRLVRGLIDSACLRSRKARGWDR